MVRLSGWYPDPRGRYDVRYFDGARWTFRVGSVSAPASPADADGGDAPAPAAAPEIVLPTGSVRPARRWRNRILIGGLVLFGLSGWGYAFTKPAAKVLPSALKPTE